MSLVPVSRACKRATSSGSFPISRPVTCAPSRAMLSAKMPPPQPTSKTLFPNRPLAFSST
ncbi:Uncharacterised protein [Vibrio cholerae]|nr:Uncharacterised protein [Vibrio cholerae]CSI26374.1 Uncharacterised protein [Vibrio cholerae]